MTLWLLKALDYVGCDAYDGFVIRASSEEEARRIASEREHSESRWLDAAQSVCTPISADGDPDIILDSYNAG